MNGQAERADGFGVSARGSGLAIVSIARTVKRPGPLFGLCRAAAGALALLGAALTMAPAQAQGLLQGPSAVRTVIDANGIDLLSGVLNFSANEVSIGQPGAGGLVYSRSYIGNGWRDNFTGGIQNIAVQTFAVSFGGSSDTFYKDASGFHQAEGRQSTLTYDADTATYTYTMQGGVRVLFNQALNIQIPFVAEQGIVSAVIYPTGERLDFHYKTAHICPQEASCPYTNLAARLQSVTNNLGYQLKFEYAASTATLPSQVDAWTIPTKVTGINNAVDYCDPDADTCASLTRTWPSATYATPADDSTARTVTDSLGRVTRYIFSNGKMTQIRRPSGATVKFGYDPVNETLSSIANGTASSTYATWTYTHATSGPPGMTITDPQSHSRSITYNMYGQIATETDALNRTTTYGYDSFQRLNLITRPEGDMTGFVYDGRGNVVSKTETPKPGSGLSAISVIADYSNPCGNPVVCDQPNYIIDARNNRTDYTYDPTHGGVLTVTAPAGQNGVHPQDRFTYQALTAYYKNSPTSFQSGSPVYKRLTTAACATLTTCAGGADEIKTSIAYVHNNLLPTSFSEGSGDGALTATTAMTYTDLGDVQTVDGPLSGTADTTTYRYDLARQVEGVIGLAFTNASSQVKRRATRIAYNIDGQATSTESGTVPSNGDWASFATLQQQATYHDVIGRPVESRLIAGGVTQALVQYAYQANNFALCSVVRMNPATFGSAPAEFSAPNIAACSPGTPGADGPDRIARNSYDAADHLTKVTNGYGTSLARDDYTATVTANGQVDTLTDAMGNRTTYVYDGFDRLKQVLYPVTSVGANASNTGDHEDYGYDNNSNVVSRRLRDGQTITTSYDASNRIYAVSALNTAYSLDNLGRQLSLTQSSRTTTLAYDALGRVTSQDGTTGVRYLYDAAGRRIRMTWPDNFYVTYDYDDTGALTTIREGGATVLASFAYDDLGQRKSLTRGNGVVTDYTYDPASRLTGLNMAITGAAQNLSFGYNPAGQIKSRTSTNSAYAWDRLYNVDRPSIPNGLNQLTTAGAPTDQDAQVLSYDPNGNLKSSCSAQSPTSCANVYGYDIANRLVTSGSSTTTGDTLAYDAMGRLYQLTTSAGVVTQFLYDGQDLIGEYTAGGALLHRYVHGPAADEPLVWYEASTGAKKWMVADQQGSVVSVTNSLGTAVATDSYNEYGIPGSANQGRFQFTGQVWLPELGLYHYKARAYSPTLGRFLQTDPTGYVDGLNWYAYVANDPVNGRDPTGLENLVSEFILYGRSTESTFFGSDIVGGVGIVAMDNPYGAENTVSEVIVSPRSSGMFPFRPMGITLISNRGCTVQNNRAAHERAVAEAGMELYRQGYLVTTNVSFIDPSNFNRRVVADLVATSNVAGKPDLIIEVKTGNGGYTRNQAESYPRFGTAAVMVPTGLKALMAGFIPGRPTTVVPVTDIRVPRCD